MTKPNPHDDQFGRATREAHWLQENAEALESSNQYVERHGLPLQAFWARAAQSSPKSGERVRVTTAPTDVSRLT